MALKRHEAISPLRSIDCFASLAVTWPEFLASLEDFFRVTRQAGLKLIVRFNYNHGEPHPNPAPDASLEQVLRHIERLAPVLEANKDVIAWFETGFIGAWGEWHTSASGPDTPGLFKELTFVV